MDNRKTLRTIRRRRTSPRLVIVGASEIAASCIAALILFGVSFAVGYSLAWF